MAKRWVSFLGTISRLSLACWPGAYSNPVFTRVFEVQDKLWEYWKDIFTPLEDVELRRKISPEQIRQIPRFKKQGIKTEKLAEMFGVCADPRAYALRDCPRGRRVSVLACPFLLRNKASEDAYLRIAPF